MSSKRQLVCIDQALWIDVDQPVEELTEGVIISVVVSRTYVFKGQLEDLPEVFEGEASTIKKGVSAWKIS